MAKRKTRARRKPSAPSLPWNGDHGPRTAAATAGTYLEPVEDEQGRNPNRMARRRRKSAIEAINLTMRQEQAAKAIQDAYGRLEMCTSGGPLKEQVDSSPKPDAAIARQVDAQSLWAFIMAPVPRADRRIVWWVCCENRPITELHRKHGIVRASERFKETMDKVADRLRY
jgi:hypothetical protein